MTRARHTPTFDDRPRAAARIFAPLCLALVACDLGDELGLDDESVFRATVSAQQFVDRVSDMARAAEIAYFNGDEEHRQLSIRRPGGAPVIHEHRWMYSAENVQVYEWSDGEHGPHFSLVVAFRGTVPTSTADLKTDIKGAMQTTTNPANPWIDGPSVSGKVGRGFNDRVIAYMESVGGQQLRSRLDDIMNIDGATLDIHVAGHSLGGIASQLFSLYAARYMASRSYDRNRYRLYDFAFNSPLGVDEVYAREFAQAVADERFFAFSLTRAGDPVSTWSTGWKPAVDAPPNAIDDTDMAGIPVGYCAHAELPGKVPCVRAKNHNLDDETISLWGQIGELAWDESVAVCMKAGYEPLVLGSD